MGRRTNKFIKAITQLKSTEIDDKLAVLEAAPTNSTMGYMSTGVHGLPKPDITKTFNNFPSLPLPDFDQDDASENGRDTSGLFNPSGVHAEGTKILVEEPPGDTSYILGPMAAMYYTWSYPWTTIGYIRESDRKMVNLAKISGKLSDWDGVSNFSSSQYGGQLTLEQAVWFRDVKKYNNSGNDPADANYRAFYPGPPSNSPDAFGRYYCTTTGEYKNRDQTDVVPDPGRTEPIPGTASADEIFAAIMDRLQKGEKLSKAEKEFLEKYTENIGKSTSQENKFLDLLNKGLKGLNNFLDAVTDNPVTYFLNNILPSKIIADIITDKVMGGGNSSSYNGQLALQLLNSVITGNNGQINLNAQGVQKMFDSIDPDKIADAINFGPPPDPNADNAINPGNKVEGVLTGGWGDQGGSEFHYDPETGMVTITSNKMLRTDDADQTNEDGKIIEFGDIPNPTTEQINDLITDQPGAQKFFDLVTDIPGQTAGMSKEEAIQAMSDYVPEFVKAVYNFTVEGTASNAVWLRQQMIELGISQQTESEQQGEGFGGHVYSQESMSIDDLDPKVKEAILSKMGNTQTNSYRPKGRVIIESRKRSILKNIKKPVVVPEEQKKFKVKPKLRTPNKWMGSTPKISKPVETPKEYKQIGGRNLWGRAEYNYNVTQSQERMNQVYELVGDGVNAFDYMLTDSKKLNDEQMEKFWGKNPDFYSYFYGGKKYKLVRKEQMDGDFLVFLVDDHGEKSNILQSELNEKLAEEQEKKELEEYNKMNPKEPVSVEKDYMFKKVQKRLKPQIDYKDKPAKKGYPNEPPPEMVNNRHPDFGKPPGSSYYNKLDPKSAEAMPQQDDPEIDAKVKDAKENPKKDSAMYRRKLDDKMKKEREKFNKEEWETSDWRKELESIV